MKKVRRRTSSNLLHIPLTVHDTNSQYSQNTSICHTRFLSTSIKSSQLPHFALLNARSLVSKIDEFSAFLDINKIDIAAVTETWFHEKIDDQFVSIENYCIYRRDREHGRGGGVCVYAKKFINSKRLFELDDDQYECMWIWLRPNRLPRPLSGIAACVLYNPPDRGVQEQRDLNEYLSRSIDSIRNKYSHCGILVLGDFNNANVPALTTRQNLKQIVTKPTRNEAILDLIFTDFHTFYNAPEIHAPLGMSDHYIVVWLPLLVRDGTNNCNNRQNIKRLVRSYSQSALNSFGRWASTNDWFSEVGPDQSVDNLVESFTSQVFNAIELHFPSKQVKFHPTDRPWITSYIKELVRKRQKAFHSGNVQQWKLLRNRVKTEISRRKKNFYVDKTRNLSKNDCKGWWDIVNKLSGRTKKSSNIRYHRDGKLLSDIELVSSLNTFFTSVNADIPSLDPTSLPAYLPSPDLPPTIFPHQVCKKLSNLNRSKACGPDHIPARLIKEFAIEFAEPLTSIFNKSLSSGIVPAIWKDSYVTPVQKIPQPESESDIRPISLTAIFSKILEDFVVSWMIEDISNYVDPRQFGSLKGSSTTYCLLDMVHNWLKNLEAPKCYLRACFLDFTKAFDRINHNIVIEKLISMNVRSSIIPWISSFLTCRRQAVKIGSTVSQWLPVTAGVPQGTKLGPILFIIMLNDLRISSPQTSDWKYVDDITFSEVVKENESTVSQIELDKVNSWAVANDMRLNPSKCKEIIISFSRSIELPPALTINDSPLERVEYHNVLGVTIQSNLKWDIFIDRIISKASKRLHILRVLKRSGICSTELLKVYIALVRSVLEYCVPVWHTSIPAFLSDEVEKVQKRAFRIIYPDNHYDESLLLSGCPLLSERRALLCKKTFEKICQPTSRLNNIVPQTRENCQNYGLRSNKTLTVPRCRTERFKHSFIPSMCVSK